MLTELYCKGETWVHTIRPSIKLLSLFVLCSGLFIVESWASLAAACSAVACLYQQAKIPLNKIYLCIRPALWILAIIFAVQLFLAGPGLAAFVVLRFLVMIFAASLVTLTTPASHLVETIETGVGKVTSAPVAEAVALAFSLSFRFIPEVRRLFTEVREAQRARALQNDWRALITPTVIRTLKSADEIAHAINARNIDTRHLAQKAEDHETN